MGKRRGLLAPVLQFASYFYRFGVFIRNSGYETGIFSTFRPPVPTISIGNITTGGTGKTPLTILLASALEKRGKVAVLSRGYRSQAEKGRTPVRVEPTSSALECGDEPVLICQTLPRIDVFVGANRTLSSQLAVERGAQALILDDGMQHRALARDFEIAMVDGADPFAGGYFLPRGSLRESPKALARASLVVVSARGEYREVVKEIREFSGAPIAVVSAELGKLPNAKKVGIFSGIARPEKFRKMVEERGIEVVKELCSPDHTLPPLEQIAAFVEECKQLGATHILCTEKDRVKLPEGEWDLPVVSTPLILSFVEGEEHWHQLLKRIEFS